MSPTWRMIVSVHCSKTCWSVWISLPYLRLQAFGGKLDGRQRVLDFMGNAARDVGPGGVALGRNQIGDVVEGHDIAVLGIIRTFGGDADDEIAVLSCRPACDLAFGRTRRRVTACSSTGTKAGKASASVLPSKLGFAMTQQS